MVPAVNVTVHSVWLMFTVLDSIHVRLAPHIPTRTILCTHIYMYVSVCIGGEGHEVVNVEEIQGLGEGQYPSLGHY